MKRFTIRWTGSEYRVSIPNLEEAEVVLASEADAENQRLRERVKELEAAIEWVLAENSEYMDLDPDSWANRLEAHLESVLHPQEGRSPEVKGTITKAKYTCPEDES